MPIDPTPRAQVGAEPVAIYCTGEATVVPGAGLATFTSANAGTTNNESNKGIDGRDFIT